MLKPFIPARMQLAWRRGRTRVLYPFYKRVWPICQDACKPPMDWGGWPDQKKFAFVLTHDVESHRGHENCARLASIEEELGFRSAMYFVPERYSVSPELRHYLTSHGFEVGVHGLKHDGKLYNSRSSFHKRAVEINRYIKEWAAVGFRSPAVQHNLAWIHDLDIEYDASTYDIDPFQPQSGGMGRIFPLWVPREGNEKGFVELPYTLPQDWTIFSELQEKNIEIWTRKVDWIAEHGGMVLLITHPDYMNVDGEPLKCVEYPAQFYVDFLTYVKTKYEGQYWHVLPRQMARFWAKNHNNPDEFWEWREKGEFLCSRCRTLTKKRQG